jgi:hypothetical protein
MKSNKLIKLNETHRDALINLLYLEPYLNGYIIADLENIGFNQENVDYYGYFENGTLMSVLMFYDRYGMYYDQHNQMRKSFLSVIEKKQPLNISSSVKSMNQLKSIYQDVEMTVMTLAVLKENETQYTVDQRVVELHTLKDFSMLYDLLVTIDEFNVSMKTKDEYIEEKVDLNKYGKTYGIMMDNQLVSTASILAETNDMAVINGVATKASYRHKRLASRLIETIIVEYVQQMKKELVLYYDTPYGIQLYKNRGFKDIMERATLKFRGDIND